MKNHFRILPWLLIAVQPAATAGDWPSYRGPHRNGHVDWASGYSKGQAWLPAAPSWTHQVGAGGSAPVVTGNTCITFAWEADEEVLHAIDLPTGKVLWRKTYPAPEYGRKSMGDYAMYSGPSSTPEIDPDRQGVYSLGNDGDLQARRLEDGSLLWKRNLYDDFDAPKRPKLTRMGHRDYGYTTSPFLLGDLLLVEAGSPSQGTVLAMDAATGKDRWWSEHRYHAGHTGGFTPIEIAGIPCLTWMTIAEVVVMRIDPGHAGKTVATWPFPVDFQNNTASLAAAPDGRILVTAGYNQKRTVCLEVDGGTLKPVWECKGWFAKVCPPVVHRNRVFFAWQQLRMVDLKTGERLWSGGAYRDPGSLIVTSDDKLIAYGGRGVVDLYDIAGDTPQLLEHRDLGYASDAWPHVVFTGEWLLTRDRTGRLDAWDLSHSRR